MHSQLKKCSKEEIPKGRAFGEDDVLGGSKKDLAFYSISIRKKIKFY